jgi:transposase-like protein
MKLSDYDLRQIDEERINKLSETAVKNLSITLLNDLKEARERLNQNSKNSSMPPSSEAPWDKASNYEDEEKDDESSGDIETLDKAIQADTRSLPKDRRPDEINSLSLPEASSETATTHHQGSPRKPGKQPGAQGFGREQKITAHQHEHHYPDQCVLCDDVFNAKHNSVAYTAFDTLTLNWGDLNQPGITVVNTRHTYYGSACPCGHVTQAAPLRQPPDSLLPNVELSQWRLIGSSLAALIVCLSFRMRLSRPRIREFLYDWLGITLSVGSINKAIHESGRAAMPLENELLEEVLKSELLHVDETPWKEKGDLLWLWVFVSSSVVAFWISSRAGELINNVLGGNAYKGWLMSDGYRVYRQFLKRIRCWAHLVRKARGLMDCYNKESQAFGKETLDFLNSLIEAIKNARETPPDKPLSEIYKDHTVGYRHACEQMKSSAHKKSRELAVEMLNDWDVIFTVLDHPHLPLTNNEAERALRHWVILRRISYGTRTEQGSRIFAILASVIETCRIRLQCPWRYLESVIDNRRAGFLAPHLPAIIS